ncbi:MAG: hypothetical protein IT531_12310 [Burkholderiales bacterium]|nr:hypothetical protein [Burkholderiales bacterium]
MQIASISRALFALSVCACFSVNAATRISYQVSDLADSIPGQDLWRYSYSVSGNFPQFFGFEILFETPKVASLTGNPVAPNADWSVSTIQPLPGVPAAGLYTAMALKSAPSLAAPFDVTFIWNGPGSPGAQSFNVLDDMFGLVASGTTAPIPEPENYVLMGIGLLILLARLRPRTRRH